MNFKFRIYNILIVLVAVLFLLIGCDGENRSSAPDNCSENQTFILERGIAHFSFEYPSCYETEIVEVREDLNYTHVTLSGPGVKLTDGGMGHTFIYLLIESISDSFPDAESTLEYHLDFIAGLPLKDYRLLERSSISVVGVEGIQIITFRDSGVREYPEDPEPEPLPTVMREIYFDYDGLIWNLSISSNQAVVEEANTIFDHIIETFKILD